MTVPSGRHWRWLKHALPAGVAVLGLLMAGWATYLNLSASQPASGAEAPGSAGTQSEGTPLEVSLPPFAPVSHAGSLSRRASLDTEIPNRPRVGVIRYTVQEGDSVFGIAKRFNIKPETVLWGSYEVLNDDPHTLRMGQELNVLPVDGTYHEWKAGDTLEGVADFYGVEATDIVDWPGNNLDPINLVIEPGTWLVVPGGKRALRQWHVPTIARGRAGVGAAYGPGGCVGDFSSGAVGTGGFVWPAGNHYISGNDYWSGHLAIDIAAGYGSRIYAADTGVVVYAGWSDGGYGNLIMIDHGNGWLTVYAHLSTVNVSCGQDVYQGGTIGLAGSTGNSTGPHLHFET
ncbi:MAG: M23 family metallopeptidase, partial [Anaerolineales bacterium]